MYKPIDRAGTDNEACLWRAKPDKCWILRRKPTWSCESENMTEVSGTVHRHTASRSGMLRVDERYVLCAKQRKLESNCSEKPGPGRDEPERYMSSVRVDHTEVLLPHPGLDDITAIEQAKADWKGSSGVSCMLQACMSAWTRRTGKVLSNWRLNADNGGPSSTNLFRNTICLIDQSSMLHRTHAPLMLRFSTEVSTTF